MKLVPAIAAVTGLALSVSAFAQDHKASPQGQGMMGNHMRGGMMDRHMMSRMDKMMDMCEKMMGDHMRRGMHHRKNG